MTKLTEIGENANVNLDDLEFLESNSTRINIT
jgi:hypothetical protein